MQWSGINSPNNQNAVVHNKPVKYWRCQREEAMPIPNPLASWPFCKSEPLSRRKSSCVGKRLQQERQKDKLSGEILPVYLASAISLWEACSSAAGG